MTTDVLTPDVHGRPLWKRVTGGQGSMCETVLLHTLTGQTVEASGFGDDAGHRDVYLDREDAPRRQHWDAPTQFQIANIQLPDRTPHPLCSRTILAKEIRRIGAKGLTALVGTELECYIVPKAVFRELSHRRLPHRSFPRTFMGLIQDQRVSRMIDALMLAVEKSDIEVCALNREYEPFQFEISLSPASPIKAADNVMVIREIVRRIAEHHDLVACMLPQPYTEGFGNGLHINLSLWNEHGPVLEASRRDLPVDQLLPELTSNMVHLAPACAVWASTENSYKRLRRKDFRNISAPISIERRDCFIRVARGARHSDRLEFRIPDPLCNPYTTIAICLAMATRLNSSVSGQHELALPRTLSSALDFFDADALMTDVLGAPFHAVYSALKHQEVTAYEREVPLLDYEFFQPDIVLSDRY